MAVASSLSIRALSIDRLTRRLCSVSGVKPISKTERARGGKSLA